MSNRKKIYISIIGTHGLPARYGGFETLIDQLVFYTEENVFYFVYCSKELKKTKYNHKNIKRFFLPFKAQGLQSVFYDIASLVHSLFTKSDIIFILGWSGSFLLPILKLFTNKTIIFHSDGLESRKNPFNTIKRQYNNYSERMAIKNADVVITDHEVLKRMIKIYYKKNAKCLTYGGDHILLGEKYNWNSNNLPDKYYLSISRIVPENNVTMILDAFKNSDNVLVYIGNWSVNRYSRLLKKKYGKFKNIYLIGPIYDLKVLQNVRKNVIAYIHGHSAGGTNPTLIEAMFYGHDIFAFDVIFNRKVTSNNAFFYKNSIDLFDKIESYKKNILEHNGKALKIMAEEKFSWKIITHQYIRLFEDYSKQN